MKKMILLFQKYAFCGKKSFSGILKFLQICWSDLFGAIGLLEAVAMDFVLILSRNDFKGPSNAKIFLILKV